MDTTSEFSFPNFLMRGSHNNESFTLPAVLLLAQGLGPYANVKALTGTITIEATETKDPR